MAIKRRDGIVIYDSNADFAGMRKAGKVAAECLDYIASLCSARRDDRRVG